MTERRLLAALLMLAAAGVPAAEPRVAFGAPEPLGLDAEPAAVAVIDVTGDPRPELLAAAAGGLQLGTHAEGAWRWRALALSPGAAGILAADLNADGRADLLARSDPRRALLQRQSGRFEPVPLALAGELGEGARVLASDDVNDDGFSDLLIGGPARSRWWLREAADPAYRPRIDLPPAAAAWLVDLDGDGGRDLVLQHRDTSATVLARQRVGFDAEGVALTPGRRITGFADLDGDGRQDLLLAPGGEPGLPWLRNRGDLAFEPAQLRVSLAPRARLRVLDLDKDGYRDLVDLTAGRWYPGSDPRLDVQPAGRSLPAAGLLAVADLHGDGHPDLLGTAGSGLVSRRNAGNANAWIGLRLEPRRFDSGRGTMAVAVRRDGARLADYVRHDTAVIGLNGMTQIDVLLVQWPSGAVSRLEPRGLRRFLNVTEPPRPKSLESERKPGSVHRFYLPGALECR